MAKVAAAALPRARRPGARAAATCKMAKVAADLLAVERQKPGPPRQPAKWLRLRRKTATPTVPSSRPAATCKMAKVAAVSSHLPSIPWDRSAATCKMAKVAAVQDGRLQGRWPPSAATCKMAKVAADLACGAPPTCWPARGNLQNG